MVKKNDASGSKDNEILDAIKDLDIRMSVHMDKLEKLESNDMHEVKEEHRKMARDIEEILALLKNSIERQSLT